MQTELPPQEGVLDVEGVLAHMERQELPRIAQPSLAPQPRTFDLTLRPEIVARPYQREVVARFFDADSALRRGYQCVPCGAGKTLIGCMVAAALGRRCLVVTTRYAGQWKSCLEQAFQGAASIAVLGDGTGRLFNDIYIGTYASLMGASHDVRARLMRVLPFDLMILDEVHAAAAPGHFACLSGIRARVCIGLTATAVREDGLFSKIEALVGPCLGVVERTDLVARGYVAPVRCYNVLSVSHTDTIESLLQSLAPSDKVVLFIDHLRQLRATCSRLKALGWDALGPVTMRTPEMERRRIVAQFERAPQSSILCISRVGDENLDLPSANVCLNVHHWSSRRQLVQRIGRIARPGKLGVFFNITTVAGERVLRRKAEFLNRMGYEFRTIRSEDVHRQEVRRNC